MQKGMFNGTRNVTLRKIELKTGTTTINIIR